MHAPSQVPWMHINDFLLDVGKVRSPADFCIQVIQKIYALIPYDQARIYFLNETGKVYDVVLFGVDKRWSDAYLDYYSKIENGRYSIQNSLENSGSISKLEGVLHEWARYDSDEFITDYIRPQGLNYSIGSGFHNAHNLTKGAFSLDRTSRRGFSREEIAILEIVQPHLDNLHKNMFVFPLNTRGTVDLPASQKSLTRRELEIAHLLCEAYTPVKISKQLFVSLPTVYRHIANIHRKLNVSNRQELLLKLMDPPGRN